MQGKVAHVNLEEGMPSVDVAIQKMKNSLIDKKKMGCKAVIIIHGYGSSGVGGSIKTAVAKGLNDSSMKGIVRTYVGGEQWDSRRKEFLAICKDLERHERSIDNNEGVTVAILR